MPGTPRFSSPGTPRLNTPVNPATVRPFRPPGSGQQQVTPRLWGQQNTPRFPGNQGNSPQFPGQPQNPSRFPRQHGTPRLSGQQQNTSSIPRQPNVTPRFQGQQNSPRFGGQQQGTPRFQGHQNTPRIPGLQNANRLPGQQQNSSHRFPGPQQGNQRFVTHPRTPNTPNVQQPRGTTSQGSISCAPRVQTPVNSQDRGCVIVRPSGFSSSQGRQPFIANSQQSGTQRPNGPRTPGPSGPQNPNMAQPYGQTSNTYQRPSGPQNSGPSGPQNSNRFQGPVPGSHNTSLPHGAYNTNQNRPQNVSRFPSGQSQNRPSGPNRQAMNSPRVETPCHMQDQNVAKSSPGGGKFTFKKPVSGGQSSAAVTSIDSGSQIPSTGNSQLTQPFRPMGNPTVTRQEVPPGGQSFSPHSSVQSFRSRGPSPAGQHGIVRPSGHPPVRPQGGATKSIIKPQGGAMKPSSGHFETADLWQDSDELDDFLTDLETEF